MNEITTLNNIIRVGTINSVDVNNRTARVAFADKADTDGKPFISAPLKVLSNSPFIPAVGVTQETQAASVNGTSHKHELGIKPWLPFIGQLVLCVYLPNGESDGFVLGGI